MIRICDVTGGGGGGERRGGVVTVCDKGCEGVKKRPNLREVIFQQPNSTDY